MYGIVELLYVIDDLVDVEVMEEFQQGIVDVVIVGIDVVGQVGQCVYGGNGYWVFEVFVCGLVCGIGYQCYQFGFEFVLFECGFYQFQFGYQVGVCWIDLYYWQGDVEKQVDDFYEFEECFGIFGIVVVNFCSGLLVIMLEYQ